MSRSFLKTILLLSLVSIVSCTEPSTKKQPEQKKIITKTQPVKGPIIIRSSLPQNYEKFTTDSTQVSQYIRCIFQDSKGNLWFGTVGEGAVRYNGQALQYFTTTEGLGGNCVQVITEDKNGTIWIGTDGGLTKYDGTNFTNYAEKDGLKGNYVLGMVIDKNQTIWVSNQSGIFKYNPATLGKTGNMFSTFITSSAGFKHMLLDTDGSIWISSNGAGVYKYDGESLHNFTTKNGLAGDSTGCMLQDKNGDIWIAVAHKGVSKCRGETFTHYTMKEGLCGERVSAMFEDKQGNIWFSAAFASGCHVCKFDGVTFTEVTEVDGLKNACLQSMLIDRAGNFWFGSGNGLFLYNGQTFVNVTKKGPWPVEV